MVSKRIRSSVVMLGLVAFATLAGDSELIAGQAARMELRKIADNVYVMQHPTGSSNSMFVVTDEGVVVWDGDIRTADQVFAAIRRTTDKKIRYHIISHPAGDHATGDMAFPRGSAGHDRIPQAGHCSGRGGAQGIHHAQDVERSRLRALSQLRAGAAGHPVRRRDDVALRRADVPDDRRRRAHSRSDVTLYIPEKRILAMGDLFKSEIHTGPGDTVVRHASARRNRSARSSTR